MSAALDTKQRVLDAAITGVFRVAQAILATPTEKRTKALDAAANSYRQTAQDLDYDEAEIQELLDVIMFRLRTEVAANAAMACDLHGEQKVIGELDQVMETSARRCR